MTACVENAPHGYVLFSRENQSPAGSDKDQAPASITPAENQTAPRTAPSNAKEAPKPPAAAGKGSWASWFGFAKSKAVPSLSHVVHVRLEAFFASIEQVLNPELRGLPVLVGGATVLSASCEAAKCGVAPGMPIAEAHRLCPEALVIPGQWSSYAEFAERIRRILERYAPVVDSSGLDGFYLDFAPLRQIGFDLEAALPRLQSEILSRTGIASRVGAATTRRVAAAASRQAALGACVCVASGTEASFLAPLPVGSLSAVSDRRARMLAADGVTTIGQLRSVPKPVLTAIFGDAAGRQIWEESRGREPRKRGATQPPTLSREASLPHAIRDPEMIENLLHHLVDRITTVLCEKGLCANSAGLRVCFADETCMQRAIQLTPATADPSSLLAAVREVLAQLYRSGSAIRSVSLYVTPAACIVPAQIRAYATRRAEPEPAVPELALVSAITH